MVKITAREKEWLIEKGYLKSEGGKINGLIVCNKEHPSRAKTYYTYDRLRKVLDKKFEQKAK